MKIVSRIRQPFQTFQWGLTWSYVFVTVTTFVLAEILGLFVMILYFPTNISLSSDEIVTMQRRISGLMPLLTATPPKIETMRIFLKQCLFDEGNRNDTKGDNVPSFILSLGLSGWYDSVIFNSENKVVLAYPPDKFTIGNNVGTFLDDQEKALLDGALSEKTRYIPREIEGKQGFIALFPIYEHSSSIAGFLFVRAQKPFTFFDLLKKSFNLSFPLAIIVTIFSGFSGLVFGYFTARKLTERLKHISEVSTTWSHGDFSSFIEDPLHDELAETSQRLNTMARDWSSSQLLREQLAVSEDRNQLARDLHDTVKQEAFASALQIATAQQVLEKEPSKAMQYLREAERLNLHMREELSQIIQELRPEDGFKESLRETLDIYIREWKKNTPIDIEVKLDSFPDLREELQKHVFRIIQGALSNVARHSQATRVILECLVKEDAMIFRISDNGKGFNSQTTSVGVGLRIIQERVESLPNGLLHIQSMINQGTCLEFQFSPSAKKEKKTLELK